MTPDKRFDGAIQRAFCAYLCLVSAAPVLAQTPPPLEAYGSLPQTSLVTLSPDGSRLAMRTVVGDVDAVSVFDLGSSTLLANLGTAEVDPWSLQFANNNNLILRAGGTSSDVWVRGDYQFSAAYSFLVDKQKVRTLMKRADVYPYQSGLGRVIGASPDGETVYIPAYAAVDDGSDPKYGVFDVSLVKIREKLTTEGTEDAIDWYVDAAGDPLIREDFNQVENRHRLWRFDGKKRTMIYEDISDRPSISVSGLTADRKHLVIIANAAESEVFNYHLMDIQDGSISEPLLDSEELDVEATITDINRVVIGMRFSGFKPRYHFFDEALDAKVKAIQERLSGMSASLVTRSADNRRLIFYVEGGWSPGTYLLFDGDNPKPVSVGSARPNIPADQVARVFVQEYEARDGLMIPALVTARSEVIEAGNAPLIVMPHGGPEAHDKYGFDWIAQFFASRGYVVLQPQFRGSDGFGKSFVFAGRGEWGQKMQTDLDDGVKYLVDAGKADPDRVCIIGASYGGYAALAGGAFSPDIYKCVVSIAGVSDLFAMLESERRDMGKEHWVYAYWEEQFGGGKGDKEQLRDISPARHADNFTAPVLLLHGKDDLVVKIDQSRRMDRALRKAGKDVTFVELDGEDHYLRQAETRMETLRQMASFIEEHL